jgi:hypothetical protein
MDECFSYNDELRKNGHLVAEEPLQSANTAVTVGWKDGKFAVTDGPNKLSLTSFWHFRASVEYLQIAMRREEPMPLLARGLTNHAEPYHVL